MLPKRIIEIKVFLKTFILLVTIKKSLIHYKINIMIDTNKIIKVILEFKQ